MAAWNKLNADPTRPLVNRAIAGNLYPPGSTFKIVTAAAALSSGRFTEESMIPGPAVLDLPDTTADLPNSNRQACGPDNKTTLKHALEISCNTAFGWLGMHLGAERFRAQAAKFGIGDRAADPHAGHAQQRARRAQPPQLAQSAIGQYDVRVTPLQVAMISAAIANSGIVMKPYLVKSVLSSDLDTIEEAEPVADVAGRRRRAAPTRSRG